MPDFSAFREHEDALPGQRLRTASTPSMILLHWTGGDAQDGYF